MEQFSLEKYLENPSRKVCTRDRNIVEIIYTNGKGRFPVIVIDPYEEETEPWQVTENGKLFCNGDDDKLDLFFADEEPESIEIPFGAFDSEFIKDEYLIPEGCEARIEGNKVIIEKVQKEELTEFEKVLKEVIEDVQNGYYIEEESFDFWKGLLLDLARKELEKEDWRTPLRAYKNGYEQGKQDALKDLPKWKKMPNDESNDLIRMFTTRKGTLIQNCKYYISLDDLETLPKEE